MKLLVTGGAGFIGSNFILYWLNKHQDDTVVNLDCLTYAGNLENLRSVENSSRYTFIRGDICDAALVDSIVKDVEVIVHFAAESHVDRSIMNDADFVRTNIVGTHTLLTCARKHSISRFHHVSTDEVYGSLDLDSKEKFSENTAYDPRSPYSASKAASDHLVRAYFHTYGLPISITNCSNNYGPFQFPEKFIPLAITNIFEDKKVPVYGDGLNVRDWLYVEDHCRAIDAVLMQGTPGDTYCIGGLTQSISNLDVIKKILAILGKDESVIEFVADRPGHDRRYAIDWIKIHKELGFTPQNDFDTYLQKTVDWYKDHRDWWKKIKTGLYASYYERQYGVHV